MAPKRSPWWSGLLGWLSSFGLAVFLLADMFLLTLFGTLEQVDRGLYEVQKDYFESLIVVHRMGPVAVPLLGGVLAMSLLAVNLLVGGLLRIRKSSRTAGIIVIHVGIAMLLAASLVKFTASDDGHLTLYEGQQSDEFVSYLQWEVVVWDASERADVQEWLIPDGAVRSVEGESQRTFRSPDLPFELTLSHFVVNGEVLPKGPRWTATGPVLDGYGLRALAARADKPEFNVAGLHVAARGPDGADLGRGILWGFEGLPWTLHAGGRTWAVSLRHRTYKMPFTIRLEDFTKEDHPGMGMAKAFMSDVTKIQDGNQRQLRIEMNEPLRDGGLVLFQSSWGPSNARPGDPLFSTFSVVRNPSDHWPLYACIVIGAGMLLAFCQRLWRYIMSQAKHRAAALPDVTP